MMATIVPFAGFNAEKDAEALRKAMKGVGTDEKAIIEVVTKRSNKQRQDIKRQYKTLYGRDLNEDFKSELTGNLENAIVAFMREAADYDAWTLNRAMKGAGTDEASLIEVVCSRTNAQIAAMKDRYKQVYGKELEDAIIGDTSGDFRRLLVSLVQGNRSEDATVDDAKALAEAHELHEAGEKSWGTDESVFNRLIAARSWPHLKAVFKHYQQVAGYDIERSIEREFSGNIERALLAVVRAGKSAPHYFARRAHEAMAGAGTNDDALIRVIVTRAEIDMVQIKDAYMELYQKSLIKAIEHDTGGDYRKLLIAAID
jgi:annexin A7/11